MKIFVFGSNGMLGRYLCKYLKNSDFHSLSIVALTRDELDLTDATKQEIKDVLLKYNISEKDIVLN